MQKNIVVLTAGGVFAEVIVNAIVSRFGPIAVIHETSETRRDMFRRWVRLRGWPTATGQLLFGPAQRVAAWRARRRRSEILRAADAATGWPETAELHHVDTVNSERCRELLRSLGPRVVVVLGTRMIRRKTLDCVSVPLINYHAGINPMYRGQYGAYWALASNDRANVGVTVHLVDEGVDTGATLYQAPIMLSSNDTIATLHHLQVVAARPLVLCAIEDALAGRLAPSAPDGPSRQWFHPTLRQYLVNGVMRGLW